MENILYNEIPFSEMKLGDLYNICNKAKTCQSCCLYPCPFLVPITNFIPSTWLKETIAVNTTFRTL